MLVFDRSAMRARAERVRRRDQNYVRLGAEFADELDALFARGERGRCAATTREGIIDCVVARHGDERNPLDAAQPAFTAGTAERCQVRFVPIRTSEITFEQLLERGVRRFEVSE